MKKIITVAILFYALGVLTIFGCAATYPFLYYAEQLPTSDCYDKGMLLGNGTKAWPDLPLDECKPDGTTKLKCITMKADDFYAARADDQKCHSDLLNCQKGAKP